MDEIETNEEIRKQVEMYDLDDDGNPMIWGFQITITGHSRNTMLKRGEKYYYLEKIRQLLKDDGLKIMYGELDTGDEQVWILDPKNKW